MVRIVIIIILIAVGYSIIRYLIRVLKQEMSRENKGAPGPRLSMAGTRTEEEYRQVLGVGPEDSPATIRRKYKELLAKYHPDKVQHLGMEFQEMAEMKTRDIMEAYEFLQRKQGL